ncbi:alginate lyase [Enterobacteriaceae bacterium RIT691]|nr:alginate lyase [Enterobacteriaceae bacterium RIT691]
MKVKLLLLSALLGSAPLYAQESACLTYDCAQMAVIKTHLAEGDTTIDPAWQALQAKADAALTHPPYSVTEKKLLPASGDKHDYYSFGPYWWPNPNTKDHLPYVRNDGHINPSSKTDDTDSERLVHFSDDVRALALAAYYSGEAKYAQKASTLLQTWFLNKTTRMNPNLDYAQAIPGVVDGRGIGIIDTRVLIDVADSIVLLHNANAISDPDFKRYQRWYSDYTHWLRTSKNGHEEENWYNNHGAWYDTQVTAFSLFSGDKKQADQQIEVFKHRHLISQINSNGELSAELERTRSFHYTNFALAAYARMGRYGEQTGNDVWNFQLDSRTTKSAFAFISTQVGKPASEWKYPELKYTPEEAMGPMLAAARAYKDATFVQSVEILRNVDAKNINVLTPGSALVR